MGRLRSLERAAKLDPGTVQAAARRTWRDIEDDCHLDGSELLPSDQEEYLTLVIGKGGQGLGQTRDSAPTWR